MDKPLGQGGEELKFDAQNLYREESFTDLRAGTIKRLQPVHADGSVDAARKPIFFGQTQVMTRAGPMPLDFEIEASTMEEAAGRFPAGVEKAIEDVVAQAREYERQQASSLIVPGGGLAAPGKIKLP